MNTLLLILGAVGSVGGMGGIAALGYIGVTRSKIRAEARKLDVDAEDVISGRALEMYDRAVKAAERAEERADAAEKRAEELGREVRALHDHVDHLERIMRNANLDPPPLPWRSALPGGGGVT